jgi:hypothetical protein
MWWQWLIAAVVVIIAVYGFVSFVRVQTHKLSDRTDHTADDVYDRYADSQRKQQRFARSHGGEWRNEE